MIEVLYLVDAQTVVVKQIRNITSAQIAGLICEKKYLNKSILELEEIFNERYETNN